jgi:mitochondrial import receptor subunit TOM40
MLMARADTNGVVLAQAKLPIDTDLSLEAVYQGMGGNDFTAAELEWKGADFVATAKTNSQGTVGISYFQQLHSKLAAGVSGEYHTEERRSRLSWAARFEPTADQIVTAEVTPKAEKGFSAQTSYYCKVGDQLAMGATLALLPGKRVADLTFGYDYTLLSGGRFRGMIGSDGKVTGLLEEKLNPITTFALSAELNHAKHEYKFGFGLTFGQM